MIFFFFTLLQILFALFCHLLFFDSRCSFSYHTGSFAFFVFLVVLALPLFDKLVPPPPAVLALYSPDELAPC